jgi:hypothetical protein
MNSMQNKITVMQDKAKLRVIAEQKDKSEMWQLVKDKSPDMALFLTQMGGAFGRLAKVDVELEISAGVYEAPRKIR